jgi:hypothetical protein
MAAMKIRKNRVRHVLIISFLIIAGVLPLLMKRHIRTINAGLLKQKKPYFVPIKIEGFSSADIPYLKVKVENQTVEAKLDLGYEGTFNFPADVLKDIKEKKLIKHQSSYGLNGKTYKSDIYQIKKINIENVAFFPVIAEEANLEFEQDIKFGSKDDSIKQNLGRIGWCLFQQFNIFVDCKHSLLALCDSLETLKRKGYAVDTFTMVPFSLNRGFIEFEAMTEKGKLRCVLDTGSTWNLLNKDLENPSNQHMMFHAQNTDQYSFLNPENKSLMIFDPKDTYEISNFNLGGKEFGPMTFNRIKSPLEIDAMIGMEFLNHTMMFIDFTHSKIYFYEFPEEENISAKTS